MTRPTITIPAPLARADAEVQAENRFKRPPVWENGVVRGEPIWHVTDNHAGGGWWAYNVRLDRLSDTERPIHLHLTDETIRPRS